MVIFLYLIGCLLAKVYINKINKDFHRIATVDNLVIDLIVSLGSWFSLILLMILMGYVNSVLNRKNDKEV